jgi:serine/threonine protein kinase
MDDPELRDTSHLSLQRLRPPAKVSGYEQEQFLGRGAFGEVWRAIDSNSGRAVAIKYYSHRGGLDWSHIAPDVEPSTLQPTDAKNIY